MNKTALMNYALFARKELESQISLSLNKLGIYKDSIKKANIVGDYTIIEGTEETFSKRVYELRNKILSQVKENGFNSIIEEFAYTWFNRIIALRFMEVHEYFDHGFRVLSSRDGSYEPEILKNVSYVIDYLKLDKNVVQSLYEQSKNEELYRYILFKQCNALSNTLPMLFDSQEDYIELLLPNNLLSKDSVIRQIQDIPEEDFLNDVEVIGWLYQFYNSVKKDEVFASKATITKETLPAVTQLFTPDWIVRYMAQNSIGRIWLESYPDSPLKSQMKYYVEDAKQEEEVQKKLYEIKYKNVNPEDLRIIEPCCGSGHILVYVFDLLLEMYKEKGYNTKDIPGKILSKNLYGLDVDKRAAQLSQFSLMMKARSIDNRFFSDNRRVIPHVYEIQDSKFLNSLNYKQHMIDFGFSKKTRDIVDYLVDTFEDGKVIGSLLKVEVRNYQSVIDEIEQVKNNYITNLLQIEFYNYGLKRIEELCKIAFVLSSKYDVMITNPPYCESGCFENSSKKYFYKYYPDTKSDMFCMFMDTGFVENSGFLVMINMHSWMFLKSFEQYRIKLLKTSTFVSLIHLGSHAFESIGGEVVQTAAFVLRKKRSESYITSIIRLINSKNKEIDFHNKENLYHADFDQFLSVPGAPFAYWVDKHLLECFSKGTLLDSLSDVRQGIIPGNVNAFLRLWHEVSITKIGFNHREYGDISKFGYKWFPYNKGGSFRKWYGNIEHIIDMENNGYNIRNSGLNNNYRLREPKYYFKSAVTWSKIGTGHFSTRFMPEGCLFDIAGCCVFGLGKKELYVLGFMNSPVASKLLEFISPTLNFEVDHIKKLPLKYENVDDISSKVAECIVLAKNDWEESENHIGFKTFPYFNTSNDLSKIFEKYIQKKKEDRRKLYELEFQINSNFIKTYDLITLNPEPCNNDIDQTITCKDRKEWSVSLISFLIGCFLGRFSTNREGIVYAGGEFKDACNSDDIDDDGIIPITKFLGIDGGLTQKICKFITKLWGTDCYQKNIDFIANSLGKESIDSSEETINKYLNETFYDDHLKIYQKRPIYWMFSSGKHGAFKCLVYMHRYNKDTLARINTKYFLPRTAMYKSEHARLQGLIDTATEARQKKSYQKQLDEVIACEKELFEYGQVLDHMANQFIDIDLDDGVKVNYEKFQNVELIVDGATIKKNLLVPIK